MPKCVKCGLSSLTLKLDFDGHCSSCHNEEKQRLQDLEAFFQEYCVVANAKAEAERIKAEAQHFLKESQDTVQTARETANTIINNANEVAERIHKSIAAKEAESLEKISHERSLLQTREMKFDLDTKSKETDIEIKLRQKKAATEESIRLAIANAQNEIAALYAAASKNFMHLAKNTASTVQKPVKANKKNLIEKRKENHPVLFIQLMPYEFKKRYKKGFVVLDFETTGLDRDLDKIIEIGAIKYNGNFEETELFSTLVNPQRSIPYRATAVNGITDSMVRSAPDISEVLPKLLDFMNDLPFASHNADFEASFLQREMLNHNIYKPISYVDTLAWSRNAYDISSHKLIDIANHLCISTDNAHRAISDCKMLGAVIEDMISSGAEGE